jgi:hypothetical protein
VAAGAAAWLTLSAGNDARPVVVTLAALGVVLTAAALVWPVTLGPALAALAAAYAVLLAIEEPSLDARAAGVAAMLVVIGELVGWARELAGATRDEPGGAWRRPIWIAGAAAGALALGWGLIALVDRLRADGLAVEAAGALAALAVLLLVRHAASTRSAPEEG